MGPKGVFDECKLVFWADIQASKVQCTISGLRKSVKTKEGLKDLGEISAQTHNFYLKSVKQFCKWMVMDGRASESPVEHLQTINVRVDRRHDRRALNADEVRRLLEATGVAPKRFGMTGYERALLYRLAAESGLRADELRSLKVSSFDFNNSIVRVKSGSTKNKKEAIMPLRPDTAMELSDFFKGKMPSVKAFGGTRKQLTKKTSDMIKADLEDAGIPYVDEFERYADFHSLRHTTGSLLAASGAHPKVAQSIMRHSDINLTMSLYTHTLRGQESEAIGNLPDLSFPSIGKQKATGTDGKPTESAYKPAYKKLTKKPYSGCNQSSSFGNKKQGKISGTAPTGDQRKSFNKADIGDDCRSMSTIKRRGRDSNPWYKLILVRRFSKPLPSATRSPLHSQSDCWSNQVGKITMLCV